MDFNCTEHSEAIPLSVQFSFSGETISKSRHASKAQGGGSTEEAHVLQCTLHEIDAIRKMMIIKR